MKKKKWFGLFLLSFVCFAGNLLLSTTVTAEGLEAGSGQRIAASQLKDASDWIEIGKANGYSLLLREKAIHSSLSCITYYKKSGGSKESVHQLFESLPQKWFDSKLDADSPLKTQAVPIQGGSAKAFLLSPKALEICQSTIKKAGLSIDTWCSKPNPSGNFMLFWRNSKLDIQYFNKIDQGGHSVLPAVYVPTRFLGGVKPTDAKPQPAAKTPAAPRQIPVQPATPPTVTDITEEQIEEALEPFNKLIGVKNIKDEVRTVLNTYAAAQKLRAQGFKLPQPKLHLILTGSPGTGKTTIAKTLAQVYSKLGVIRENKTICTERESLIAQFIGHTAAKTKAKIDESRGGIFFIDEAYTLVGKGEKDFGPEALECLLTAMTELDDFVVVAAGYPDKMREFLKVNAGFSSRFNKILNIEDYTSEELIQIFELQCKDLCNEHPFTLTPEMIECLKAHFDKVKRMQENFGNGRYVGNLFGDVLNKIGARVMKGNFQTEQPILLEDIQLGIQDREARTAAQK